MRVSEEQLQHRAEHIARHLRISSPKLEVAVIETQAVLGGGSAPGTTLPSRAVAVRSSTLSADQMLQRLRQCGMPIIGRVEDARVLLDLRTVWPEQDAAIVATLEEMANQ
jgi:L-seryl-tRNA(Ser) seleniumtransferase